MKKLILTSTIFMLLLGISFSIETEQPYINPTDPVFTGLGTFGTLSVTGNALFSNIYLGGTTANDGTNNLTMKSNGVIISSRTMTAMGVGTTETSFMSRASYMHYSLQDRDTVGNPLFSFTTYGETNLSTDFQYGYPNVRYGRMYYNSQLDRWGINKQNLSNPSASLDIFASSMTPATGYVVQVSSQDGTYLLRTCIDGITEFSQAPQLASKTIAQIKAITPKGVGQLYYCNDSVPPSIYVSTGTSVGMFGKISMGNID